MAAEARDFHPAPPIQHDFASAWLTAWRLHGGKLTVDRRGGRAISFPLSGQDTRQLETARRALMIVFDGAGHAARDAVFAAAAREA